MNGRAPDSGAGRVVARAHGRRSRCTTQETPFYAKTFPCTLDASNDQCGTTQAGKPMVCYPGSQLGGGTDFCAEACDPAEHRDDSQRKCMTSGALLQTCKPGTPRPKRPSRRLPVRAELLSHDLFDDEGVCLMMTVCKCGRLGLQGPDAQHVRRGHPSSNVSPSAGWGHDNLQCIKPTCQTGDLRTARGTRPAWPSSTPWARRCRTCASRTATRLGSARPTSPVPWARAVPGRRRCACPACPAIAATPTRTAWSARCVRTPGPASTNARSVSRAASDADCAYLDGLATFVCVEGVPGAGAPLHGDSRRSTGPIARIRPSARRTSAATTTARTIVDQGHGECRAPCDVTTAFRRAAASRTSASTTGGGGCYPGVLGLPCTPVRRTACPNSRALPAGARRRSLITSPMICTTTCTSDLDCTSDPLIANLGFCQDGAVPLTGARASRASATASAATACAQVDASGGRTVRTETRARPQPRARWAAFGRHARRRARRRRATAGRAGGRRRRRALADNLTEVAISTLAERRDRDLVGMRELRGRLPRCCPTGTVAACLRQRRPAWPRSGSRPAPSAR